MDGRSPEAWRGAPLRDLGSFLGWATEPHPPAERDDENSPGLDVRLEQLASELGELRELLRERDRFWFTWMDRAVAEIKQADTHGLDRLLAAYGGMGSFNDLVLVLQPHLAEVESSLVVADFGAELVSASPP